MRIAENIPAYVKPGAVLKLAGDASFEAYTKPTGKGTYAEETVIRGKDFADYFLVLEVATPAYTTFVKILDARGVEWLLAVLPDWPRQELELMLLVPENRTG